MNQYGKHNIASCLLKRQQNILSLSERRSLHCFGEDLTARLTNNTVKCQLPGSPRSTFLVAFSPDRQTLATTHGDHTIRIINGNTGRCLDTLEGHPRTPWSISFHPSQNNLLASGCLGGEVRVWDLKRRNSTVFHSQELTVITSLAFHPSDSVLLIATGNQLLFWNWDQPTPFACIDTASEEQKLHLVKFDPWGHYILTGIRNSKPESCSLATSLFPRNECILESDNEPEDFHNGQRPSGVNVARVNIIRGGTGEGERDPVSNNSEDVGNREVFHGRMLPARLARLQQQVLRGQMGTQFQSRDSTNMAFMSSHHHLSPAATVEPSSRLRRRSAMSFPQGNSISYSLSPAFYLPHLQRTINHAIADALAERGNIAVASNIISTTYRLQWWDFTKLDMPKLKDSNSNVIVEKCKLHNDASTDISADGCLLSAFVPRVNSPTEFGNVCVFSLQSHNLGQCLFSKKLGPNAISVSFSPLARYLLVGLASRKYHLAVSSDTQLVAQVFRFNDIRDETSEDVEDTMEHVSSLKYKCPSGMPNHYVSINAAFWHPVIGSGLVYGTNKGEVQLCHIRSGSS